MIAPRSSPSIRTALPLAVAASGLLAAVDVRSAAIPEPATVFYGQIIGTASERPFLVTEGTLTWTIRRADGRDLVLETELYPLKGGEFSYRLNVPHEALASGLSASGDVVGLRAASESHAHGVILVDGLPAAIIDGGGATFDAAQAARAATYRLDLEVALEPEDTDGDGIPDWWEDLYGLDKDDPTDALGDGDGDGVPALAEYRGGSDPGTDSRRPELISTEFTFYPGGVTGLPVQVRDADSDPASIIFTLSHLPAAGDLVLRDAVSDPVASDRVLAVGDTFSQADVEAGRLVFLGQAVSEPVPVELELHDGDPDRQPSLATLLLTPFAPPSEWPEGTSEEWAASGRPLDDFDPETNANLRNQRLAADLGFVVWDGGGNQSPRTLAAPSASAGLADYESVFGPEPAHALFGGAAGDRLSGGWGPDLLVGGPGSDHMRGGAGGDRFVITGAPGAGDEDEIEDFRPEEGDIIDMTPVLAGSSRLLSDFIRLSGVDGATVLGVDAAGDGGGFGDFRIILPGVASNAETLRLWVETGALVAEGYHLETIVTFAEAELVLGENEDATTGALVLRRTGSLADPLTVGLRFAGSAENGRDVAFLEGSAVFEAGQSETVIPITVYPDQTPEPTETLEVAVLAGDGYQRGAAATARIRILDLVPVVGVEILESLAERVGARPAVVALRRSGRLDTDVLVRLQWTGTAVAGIDYEAQPSFVTLGQGQTTRLLEIRPGAPRAGDDAAESVELIVRADAAYQLGTASRGRVFLVNEASRLAAWRERHFPEATDTLADFAARRVASGKPTHLQLYAFGIDPQDLEAGGRPEGLPVFKMDDGHLTVLFRRPAAIRDVDYLVEVSSDLNHWQAGPGVVEEVFPPEHVGDPEMTCYRLLRAVSNDPMMIMRVRLQLRP